MSFHVSYSPTINKTTFIVSETTGNFSRVNPSFGTKYAPSLSEQSYIMNMIQEYGGSSTGSTSIQDIRIVNQEVLGFIGKVDNVSSTLKATIKTSDILCQINGTLTNSSTYTFGKKIPNRIVCVGHDNTSIPSSGSLSYSDDNGVSWTNMNPGPNTLLDPSLFAYGKCIAWNGELWVVGLDIVFSLNQKISLGWSLDGINWYPNAFEENNTPIFSVSCNGLVYINYTSNNLWLAVGEGTTYTTASSKDGINWIGGDKTTFTVAGNGIAWSGSSLVMVGRGTNTIAFSSINNTSLIVFGTTIFSTTGNGVAWNGSRWVAVGEGTNTIATSTDGTTWIGVDSSPNVFIGGAGITVAWNGKIWVAGGSGTYTLAYSCDGIGWVQIGNPIFTGSNSNCKSITWNITKFIAVGTWENTADLTKPFGVATSEDGINWTPVYSATFTGSGVASNNIRQNTVTIQKNINIAVGTGTNTMAYSYDGINWTGISNTLFTTAYAAVFNGRMWVVGGEGNNTIAYSIDGIKNWIGIPNNNVNNPFYNGACYGLAWNGKRFVGCGYGDTSILSYTIATSEDGICWIEVADSRNVISTCFGVSWNGNMFVAVGNAGFIGGNTIATSPDGLVWTGRSTSIFVSGFGVSWNGKLWVAVGGGYFSIATSPDGISWTGVDSTTHIFNGGAGYGVAWNGQVWVAVGGGNKTIAWSEDGENWTDVPDSTDIVTNGQSISWTGNRFVAVGVNSATSKSIVWSNDGKKWNTVVNSNTIFSTGYEVAWSSLQNSVYIKQPIVIGGAGDNQLVYSDDGINWIGVGTSIFENGGCASLCWNGQIWIAGGGQCNNSMAWSTDGKNWTGLGNSIFSQQSSQQEVCLSIYWNGKMFVAVGSGMQYSIVYSQDGKNWTGVTNSLESIQVIQAVSWNGKIWVVGGFISGSPTKYIIGTSNDGITWNCIETTICNGIRDITWNGQIWVILCNSTGAVQNSICWSYDAITWTGLGNTIFSISGIAIDWNGNRFVAVGEGTNKIAWSDDGTIWTGLGNTYFATNLPASVSWVGNQWLIGGYDSICYTSIYGEFWNENPIVNINITKVYLLDNILAIQSNSLVGPVVVDSQIIINTTESLDVVSDSYYNTGYTNMSMSIASTVSS
jgi:hypothetical protein